MENQLLTHPLRLMRIQRDTGNPVEAGQRGPARRVGFPDRPSRDQLLLPLIQTGEGAVRQVLLAYFLPDLFDGVEGGTPSGAGNQFPVRGHREVFRFVPTGSVPHHHPELVGGPL
jgi:hypothetical protein